MFPHGFSLGDRATATLALVAFVVVMLGSSIGFAVDADAGRSGEPCVGCSGCDAGQCGEDGENPLTSHHHCCTTCCLSHAPVALLIARFAPAPVISGPLTAGTALAVADRSPETPYRPPRV